MNRHDRTLLEIIRRHGCKVLTRRQGKHIVYRLLSAAGKVVTWVVPSSPSDADSYKIDERRLARALEQ